MRRIEQVFFDLVPADGKPPQRGSTSPIDDALTVSWQGLPAGSYRLEVRAYGALGPCLSLDLLQVRSGERLDDPRLQPLDLRRVLTGMHVRLVDDGGAPVQPNEVYLYVYDRAPPHVRND